MIEKSVKTLLARSRDFYVILVSHLYVGSQMRQGYDADALLRRPQFRA